MITIKKNTYEIPTEIREEAVQAICDAFLTRCCWSTFHPFSEGCYRRATKYVLANSDGKWYGFHYEPFSSSESKINITGVEMREAFKELRKAGYHIFRVYEFGSWMGYKVSDKPYLQGGSEVTDFNDFID
jgi:hypothetical protein